MAAAEKMNEPAAGDRFGHHLRGFSNRIRLRRPHAIEDCGDLRAKLIEAHCIASFATPRRLASLCNLLTTISTCGAEIGCARRRAFCVRMSRNLSAELVTPPVRITTCGSNRLMRLATAMPRS